jgi:NAD(P)-dependent dehydrogenase (short-subunit alcohol dehydrogenase family)
MYRAVVNCGLTPELPARVVSLSSVMHTSAAMTPEGYDERRFKYDRNGDYNRATAYGTSKFCNVLMALDIDERFQSSHKSIVGMSVHPGVINTNLFKDIPCESAT